MKNNVKHLIPALGCLWLMTGCTQLQQHEKNPTTPAPISTTPPGLSTMIAYFPSGTVAGSGLMVEKTAPELVLVGHPYSYSYTVSNMTPATLENVIVMDRVTSNFIPTDSDPAASSMASGKATWNLGAMAPNESKTIIVRGTSAEEGVVTTCGWASYNPVLCQDIHIVKASIALTKSEPPEVLICDPIPITLTVKNTGSSQLTRVHVIDTLPTGMTAAGKSLMTFDTSALAPGESTNFEYAATATNTGTMVNRAKVTCTEGVTAEASASTKVRQPILAISCKATDREYVGREFDVNYTVSDLGDAAAAGSRLEVTVPAGLDIVSAGTGQAGDGKIDYDLGTLDTNYPQTVTATFSSVAPGKFDFTGSASGTCASVTSTICETKVIGLPATHLEKSGNPNPLAIGGITTYTVTVTNQGSADDSNLAISIIVGTNLAPVGSDQTNATIKGQRVTFRAIPTLGAKESVTYTVRARGVSAGVAETRFILSSDSVTKPIMAEESTTVY